LHKTEQRARTRGAKDESQPSTKSEIILGIYWTSQDGRGKEKTKSQAEAEA